MARLFSHRDYGGILIMLLIGQMVGLVLVFVGAVMYAVPADRKPPVFEFYINNLDFAPAIVGTIGAMVFYVFGVLRQQALGEVEAKNREIRAEANQRWSSNTHNDPEFLARLDEAGSLNRSIRRATLFSFWSRLSFYILLTGALIIYAFQSYREANFGPLAIACAVLGVMTALKVVFIVLDRPHTERRSA